MPQDHQHVVGYVIGEECIKVVSFFSSMQYVRALAQLSCRLARENEQNNTLAHVMCEGFIQRCRRTFIFVSSNHIFQTFTTADNIIQIGEAYIGLGTCRFEGSMCVLLFLPRPRGTSASLVVPTSCWCFPAFGAWELGK